MASDATGRVPVKMLRRVLEHADAETIILIGISVLLAVGLIRIYLASHRFQDLIRVPFSNHFWNPETAVAAYAEER